MTLPAFCRVEATARPTSDSEIKFEVWIPPVECVERQVPGRRQRRLPGIHFLRGDGHRAAPRLRDGEHRHRPYRRRREVRAGPSREGDRLRLARHSCHDRHGEAIVRNAQGRFADKSYFVGCSAGGHQAMSEAQRFPDDYDGIVAGAPANNRIRQTFAFMHSWTATHNADGSPILTAPKLALVTKAAVAACDANDTLKDGLIEDPRKCSFDAGDAGVQGRRG